MKDFKTNTRPIGLIWAVAAALLLLALGCPVQVQGDKQELLTAELDAIKLKVKDYDPTTRRFLIHTNKPAHWLLEFRPQEGQNPFPALLMKVGGKVRCHLEPAFFGFVCNGERFEIVTIQLERE